ncbi:MAG: response regulator transcription factor [Wenzhouxiangella sp.]
MARNILIADNEANLLMSLEYLMQRQGFGVSLARDGLEAMTAIRRQAPDLVIVDAAMPGQSGFEICQQVRADPRLRAMPIVMLSAKARATDIAKGRAMGADAYVVKPFSTNELVDQVCNLLDQGR